MRTLLSLPILAVAIALANPVYAAEPAPEAEFVEKLNDPEFQDGLVTMMGGFLGAMMELPIGQIATTMEKAIPEEMKDKDRQPNIDPEATIGDLARRDDPNFERNMDDKLRQGTAMMGIMATEFGALLPQLRALGDRMKQRMENLD